MNDPIDDGSPLAPPVSVAPMPQLVELRDPSDDWTGVTSTAERKRRQNRLNQRAYRRRKHALQDDTSQHPSEAGYQQTEPRCKEDPSTGENDKSSAGYVLIPCPKQRARIQAFMQQVYEEYSVKTPRPRHLQLLIRLNALNAITLNAIALGFAVEGLCHDDTISPFNAEGPKPPGTFISFSSSPESLRPTTLQVSVRHHPWLDLFPFPKMRDNIIRGIEAELFDEDELCADLLEVEDLNQDEKASLLVWGQSYDFRAWEASVAFLKKWGWLVQDSPELLEATNQWRTRRGEKPLRFPIGAAH